MMMKYLLGSLAISLALGACGKGNDLEAFMNLDIDKAAAFAAGGQDCDAKAKPVGEWRAKHETEYNALRKKLNDKWGNKPPKDFIAKYGDQLKANTKAVVLATMACQDNAAFGKMMDDTKTE